MRLSECEDKRELDVRMSFDHCELCGNWPSLEISAPSLGEPPFRMVWLDDKLCKLCLASSGPWDVSRISSCRLSQWRAVYNKRFQ